MKRTCADTVVVVKKRNLKRISNEVVVQDTMQYGTVNESKVETAQKILIEKYKEEVSFCICVV